MKIEDKIKEDIDEKITSLKSELDYSKGKIELLEKEIEDLEEISTAIHQGSYSAD